MPPLPIFLTAADTTAIRSAIRADLTVSELSDAIVQASFGSAARSVLVIDPNASTYADGSDEQQRVHDAAVLYAAAFLTPITPQIIRESFQGYSYAVEPFDPRERAMLLREMAALLLLENLGLDASALRPTAIALGPGGRGDVSDDRYPVYRPGLYPRGYP